MDILFNKHFIIWLLISAAIAGCNKPLSYPETKDPIFADILQDLENSKHQHEQAEKDVAKAQDEYNKAPIRSRMRKMAEEVLFDAKKKLDLADQDLLYKSQRVSVRRKLDRETYKKAFEEGKEWPRPEEYNEYLTHKKLGEAPREWKPHIAPRSAAEAGGHDSGGASGESSGGGHH